MRPAESVDAEARVRGFSLVFAEGVRRWRVCSCDLERPAEGLGLSIRETIVSRRERGLVLSVFDASVRKAVRVVLSC